jgi:hypothetical protein
MKIDYLNNSENFKDIPGSIFCYWLSENAMRHIKNDEKLDAKRIGFDCLECNDTNNNDFKWFPYNKAGSFRRWSSINDYVVNYQNDGKEIKETVMKKYPYLNGPGFVVKNTESYFHHGITWNDVATGLFCARYVPNGFIFADAGPMFFSKDDFVMLGYFNSTVFQLFASVICQGLHYSTGHIPQIPFAELNEDTQETVKEIVEENYSISKIDWDSFENSWDFKKHPLV